MLCSGYIQASRALMITAIVCGTFGLVAALIGIQCSKAGGDNHVLKGRIAGTAGVLFLIQGNKDKKKCIKRVYFRSESPKLRIVIFSLNVRLIDYPIK